MFGTKKKLEDLRLEFKLHRDKTNDLISKLQWQINNPHKYKIGQNVKGLGVLEKLEIENRMNGIIGVPLSISFGLVPQYHYKYTFKNKNKTITVCE